MKIGIIGSGNIGGILARHWAQAGHEVMISSRHPEKLKTLAKSLGSKVRVGKVEEAARFGEVVLLSIPLGEIPKLSKETLAALRGKIIMDTCNPYPERDGKHGEEALNASTGSGVWAAKYIPGARLVKAFNTIYYRVLEKEAHRQGELVGVPLAADDKEALTTVAKLVQEAGFDPVIVGPLRRAKEFDHGTPPYGSEATASELHKMLGLKKRVA